MKNYSVVTPDLNDLCEACLEAWSRGKLPWAEAKVSRKAKGSRFCREHSGDDYGTVDSCT